MIDADTECRIVTNKCEPLSELVRIFERIRLASWACEILATENYESVTYLAFSVVL
jgi:hypothetical protein